MRQAMAQQYGSWAARRLIPVIALCAVAVWTLYGGLSPMGKGVPSLNALSFGATANGNDVDTEAIQKAIDECSSMAGCWHVKLTCPKGQKTCIYMSGSLWLASDMTFEVGAGVTLKAVTDPSAFPFVYARFEGTMRFGHAGLLNAGRCLRMSWFADTSSVLYPAYPGDGDMCWRWRKVRNLTITGDGVIDGQGDWWWRECFRTKDGTCPDGSNQRQRPSLMKLLWVDGLRITRLTLRDSPFWFIHPVYCNDVALAHVAAVAPADSRNTDGFDPDSCTNVHVTDCVFETGDDCIAVKSGRGAGGILIGRPTEHVVVERCEFRFGHGVTVGSEMSGGVRNVTFRDSRVVRTKVAFRIKTTRGRGGVIEDVVFRNFQVVGTPLLLSVDMNYENTKSPRNIPVVRRIAIADIAAENVGQIGKMYCLPESPCMDVSLHNISVAGQTRPFKCENAYGTERNVAPYAGCLLSP